MRDPKLTDAAVQAALALRSGWSMHNGMIVRTFAFANFVAALRFVNAIAEAAEVRSEERRVGKECVP